MDTQTILTYVFSLIGVLLGGVIGLFSPIISNIFDKTKRKRQIKQELLKTIYLFYSVTKEHCRVTCQYNFLIKRDTIYRFEKPWLTDPERIKEFEWIITNDRELNQHNLQKAESLFLIVSEYEATLIALTHEIESYYGNEKFIVTDSIIKGILKESNKPNRFPTNLTSTTSIQLDKEHKEFDVRVSNFINHIQYECDSVIDKIGKGL